MLCVVVAANVMLRKATTWTCPYPKSSPALKRALTAVPQTPPLNWDSRAVEPVRKIA